MHADGGDSHDGSDCNLLEVGPSRVRRKAAQAVCSLLCFSLIVLSLACWSALVKSSVGAKIHPLSTGNLQTLDEKQDSKDATNDGSQNHDSTDSTRSQPDELDGNEDDDDDDDGDDDDDDDGNEENTGVLNWASGIFTTFKKAVSQPSQTWTNLSKGTKRIFKPDGNETGIVAWVSQSCDSFEDSKILKAKEVFEHKTNLLGGEHHWAIVASKDRQFRLELYPISGERSLVQISCIVLHGRHPESDQDPKHGWSKANRTLTLRDIKNKSEEYARQNPIYNVVAVPLVASANNCQTYIKDLMEFITGNEFLTQTEESERLLSITPGRNFLIWVCCMIVWSLLLWYRVQACKRDSPVQVIVCCWLIPPILITLLVGIIPYFTPLLARLIGPASLVILVTGCCLGVGCSACAILIVAFEFIVVATDGRGLPRHPMLVIVSAPPSRPTDDAERSQNQNGVYLPDLPI